MVGSVDRDGSRAPDRLAYSLIAAGAALVLLIARLLVPSPTGIGTHEQLGLPACTFFKVTGWPCPNCGMTTSFAYAAHLQFANAFHAQPFGLLLFITTCLSLPVIFFLVRRRIPISHWMFGRWSNPVLYVLIALYLLGWLYKLSVR